MRNIISKWRHYVLSKKSTDELRDILDRGFSPLYRRFHVERIFEAAMILNERDPVNKDYDAEASLAAFKAANPELFEDRE